MNMDGLQYLFTKSQFIVDFVDLLNDAEIKGYVTIKIINRTECTKCT